MGRLIGRSTGSLISVKFILSHYGNSQDVNFYRHGGSKDLVKVGLHPRELEEVYLSDLSSLKESHHL